MKRTAVLPDLGFVLHKLYRALDRRHATANEVSQFARKCLTPSEEELFRIYCYHCPPYGDAQTHPFTGEQIDFSKTDTFTNMNSFLRDLKVTDNVAFRGGELSFDGWQIRKRSAKEVASTGRELEEGDFVPDLSQKRVDMKIGLDVAWLSSKSIVDRLILVTGDSDFVPAMKFARREGVQVILVTMGHGQIKQELKIHADEHRMVSFP